MKKTTIVPLYIGSHRRKGKHSVQTSSFITRCMYVRNIYYISCLVIPSLTFISLDYLSLWHKVVCSIQYVASKSMETTDRQVGNLVSSLYNLYSYSISISFSILRTFPDLVTQAAYSLLLSINSSYSIYVRITLSTGTAFTHCTLLYPLVLGVSLLIL